MLFKVLLLISLAIAGISGAPRPNPVNLNAELLEKSLAEYLKHDPELVRKIEQLEALTAPDVAAHPQRVKRQEDIDESTVDIDVGEGEKQPGFFDRAAKFVVELLQRFLRWVNSDNS